MTDFRKYKPDLEKSIVVRVLSAIVCPCPIDCHGYCPTDKFEESKENKLEYMELFEQYTSLIEQMIEDHLTARVPVSLLVLSIRQLIIYGISFSRF
jgi:hypothetical protein